MAKLFITSVVANALFLTACASTPFETSDQHIQESFKPEGSAPALVQNAPLPEPPSNQIEPERFTVVVNAVPVKDLLFSMARDAGIDIDISKDVEGTVTLNALDVSFNQLLERISEQAPIRYNNVNGVVKVEADTAYLKHYDINYVSMDRTSESTISIATEVSSTGTGSESLGNISSTSITNASKHQFWQMLSNNISSIIEHDEEKQQDAEDKAVAAQKTNSLLDTLVPEEVAAALNQPATPDDGAADETEVTEESEQTAHRHLMLSPESGVLSVFATQDLHHQIGSYLDKVLSGAQRQVFIEATIVEVELNDSYQAGVDWSRVVKGDRDGFSFTQGLTGTNLLNDPVSTLNYTSESSDYSITSAVKLLSQFGDTKVLSTPKILALNNQTALLKVVDNRVYFTINVETDTSETGLITRTFETVIHTLPVGLVMSVTPHTSSNGDITLNVRPTISRILRFVKDPNPALEDIESLIPEVSVREIETILRVKNGDVAVIGGLMQDNSSKATNGVPTASKIPFFGNLFSYKERKTTKSELVIFLKPIVTNTPTLDDEFAGYKRFLSRTDSIESIDAQNAGER